MKIDLSRNIMIDGIPAALDKDKPPLTLGQVCRMALNAPAQDRSVDIEAMVRKGNLAIKVAKSAPEEEATPEEISMIRACLPNMFQNAEFVAVVYEMLGE